MGDQDHNHQHIIALVYPKEGKAHRVEELLANMSKQVREHEKDTLRYHVLKEMDHKPPRFIVNELYRHDQAAQQHMTTDHFKHLVESAQKEDLMAKPFEIIHCRAVAGFGGRDHQ